MQRIRIRYTKEGRVRFVSARDMTSVWERALRRVDLPIAYSEGFSPHAKVSFPDALPVGYASTGEYAELTFAVPIDPGPDLGRLSATLPEGMDVTTWLDVPDGAPKLARMLPATLWELVYPAADAEQAQRLTTICDNALTDTSIEVVRHRPDADRTLDIRPALIDLATTMSPPSGESSPMSSGDNSSLILRAVIRNDGPTVRPTDLHNALRPRYRADSGDLGSDLPDPRLYRRVAQGESVEGGLREALGGAVVPLAPDRLVGAA